MRVTYTFSDPEDTHERELFEFGYRHVQTLVAANVELQNVIRKYDKYGVPAEDLLEEIKEIIFDLPELEED